MPPAKKKTSTSRAEKKAAPKKTSGSSGKKRTSRKKRGGSARPLFFGILIGLILACVGAWGVYSFLQGREVAERSTTRQERRETPPSRTGTSRPDRGAQPGQQPGKGPTTAQPDQGSQRGKTISQPRPGSVPDVTPETTPEISPEERAAVSKALQELQNLPYEEIFENTLDERIRQVDYAFLQTGLLMRLPASSMRFSVKDDQNHQDVDILPGADSREYVAALKKALGVWVNSDVRLERVGPEEWTVTLGKVETHRLRFYPGQKEFPPVGPGRTPDDRPEGAKKTRAAGQAARMVIVIDDMGESRQAVKDLLALNFPVTFAFWPFSGYAKEGATLVHKAGREVLVHYPMQPVGYPKVNAGPGVLLVGMDAERIQALVEEGISRVPYATGLNNHMGSRFTQNAAGVDQVLAVLKRRNLFILDSLTHDGSVFHKEAARMGVTAYKRNVFLDHTVNRADILAQLKKAENIALLTGQSVAIGHPHPETLEALRVWQKRRDVNVRMVRLCDLAPE